MKNIPAVSNYRKLLTDIGRLYEGARQAVAEAYWKIGQRLVDVEQNGAEHAKYGEGLLERLSRDLSAKYGRGFSVYNLERMRHLYLTHPISAAPRKLAWTHYVELLSVGDQETRKRLERRAETENLSSRQLRQLAAALRSSQSEARAPPSSRPLRSSAKSHNSVLRRPTNLKLHTYKLADAPGVPVPDGHILADCGFCIYRLVPSLRPWGLACRTVAMGKQGRRRKGGTPGVKYLSSDFVITKNPAYTYAATVERVIDGDTIWALIDIGFGTIIREKLRLHGIDAPDIATPEGKEAADYVARVLPAGTPIVIRSYSSDMYGRFVADILYAAASAESSSSSSLPASRLPAAPAGSFESLVFLNAELLSKGYAVRMVRT